MSSSSQNRDAIAQVQRVVHRAHQVDQFLMDNTDHLLAGVQGFQYPFAQRLLADALHEVLDDRQADLRLQ